MIHNPKYSEDTQKVIDSVISRYCSHEGKTALEWTKCRPSDQFRRADMLQDEITKLALVIHGLETAIKGLAK